MKIFLGLISFFIWEEISFFILINPYMIVLGFILFGMWSYSCSEISLERREKENWKNWSDRWHIRAIENSTNHRYKGDISSFIFYEEPVNEYSSIWNTWQTFKKYKNKRYY